MYVFNICQIIMANVAHPRKKRKTRTTSSAHNQSPFTYYIRLLNINPARFAAGWKRNFSLLRHTLYHAKKLLSSYFYKLSAIFLLLDNPIRKSCLYCVHRLCLEKLILLCFFIDKENKLLTTPAYMVATRISQIFEGSDNLIQALYTMIQFL